MHTATTTDTPLAIETDHPGWHVWRARNKDGRPASWMATRRDPAVGVDPTVMALSAEELRKALTDQRRRADRGIAPVDLTIDDL